MKRNQIFLLPAYGLSLITSIIYFKTVPDCTGYWMHDGYIDYNFQWLIFHSLYLFLLPALILIGQIVANVQTTIKAFLTQLVLGQISLIALAFCFKEPCQEINGGHYMFIHSFGTPIYYLTKLIGFFTICYIIYKSVLGFVKRPH